MIEEYRKLKPEERELFWQVYRCAVSGIGFTGENPRFFGREAIRTFGFVKVDSLIARMALEHALENRFPEEAKFSLYKN
jgi:hypothetical protein